MDEEDIVENKGTSIPFDASSNLSDSMPFLTNIEREFALLELEEYISYSGSWNGVNPGDIDVQASSPPDGSSTALQGLRTFDEAIQLLETYSGLHQIETDPFLQSILFQRHIGKFPFCDMWFIFSSSLFFHFFSFYFIFSLLPFPLVLLMSRS